MHTLFLYSTKTGSTKQYVNWLSWIIEDSEIREINEIKLINLDNYNRIVFALPTYGGQIDQKDLIEEYWEKIKNKKIFLIVVGMVPQNEKWSQIAYNTIGQAVRDGLSGYVKLPGINPNSAGKRMSWFEKFLLKVFLRVDFSKIKNQTSVQKEDLKPAIEMLTKSSD